MGASVSANAAAAHGRHESVEAPADNPCNLSHVPDVLTVIFQHTGEFLAQEVHLSRGAFFLPVPEPPPEPLAELVLRVETPARQVVELLVRVVQLSATHVALALEDPRAAGAILGPSFEAARSVGSAEGATWVFWGRPADPPAPVQEPAVVDLEEGQGDDAEEGPLYDQIRAMSAQEKIRLAVHGDRPARLILVKDQNKTIHTFLLQNPRITLDEIRYIAGYHQANPDALVAIAGHRDWAQNPHVLVALARNPKTPTPTALKLLDKIPLNELRRLAKSAEVPRAVQVAARKRVTE
jgi:hypothetical protein